MHLAPWAASLLVVSSVDALKITMPSFMPRSTPTVPTSMAPPADAAKYMVDLHEAKETFNFCGGMPFQLVLSDALKAHLTKVASGEGEKLSVFGADAPRMANIPGYQKSAEADNCRVFHGREVRQVPHAKGGMGFVLHLSLANGDDPEGWTAQEIAGYDGWGHDSGRDWRTGDRLENEGFGNFRAKFGPSAFTLHHRFYLHMDRRGLFWLAAEDGCEGHAPVA
jgi:hypothetical protein